MAMTMTELAHQKMYPTKGGEKGITYGEWLVAQTLPKVVEQMGQGAGPHEIASRTMMIVNQMLTRMTTSE